MKKFKIVSLGCRTNQYESQAYSDQLIQLGYTPAIEGEEAEICIVNTCTVTESADSSSRHAIRQIAHEHHPKYLLVTGCFAENDPSAVQTIHGVTHVVTNKEKEKLLALIAGQEELPEFSICRFEAHTRAFLKIQRSEERRVGKECIQWRVDLGGRRIIQAEDGIRDSGCCDWSSDVCSSDLC